MTLSDFDRLLRATLSGQEGLVSVTLTDIPDDEHKLGDLIRKAADMAELKGARLVEIMAPLSRLSTMGRSYRGVPVRDCGRSGVLRLVYEAQSVAA